MFHCCFQSIRIDAAFCVSTLQNYGSAGATLHFFIFDLLILKGKDVMGEPLTKRRELIEEHVLPHVADPIRYSPVTSPLSPGEGGSLAMIRTFPKNRF